MGLKEEREDLQAECDEGRTREADLAKSLQEAIEAKDKALQEARTAHQAATDGAEALSTLRGALEAKDEDKTSLLATREEELAACQAALAAAEAAREDERRAGEAALEAIGDELAYLRAGKERDGEELEKRAAEASVTPQSFSVGDLQ